MLNIYYPPAAVPNVLVTGRIEEPYLRHGKCGFRVSQQMTAVLLLFCAMYGIVPDVRRTIKSVICLDI